MKNIKDVVGQGAQGDVLFIRVDKVPAGFVAEESAGPIVVAHSETGHHHTVPGLDAVLYTNRADPMSSYLVMRDGVDALPVTHHRPYDTHKTFSLLGESRGGGSTWLVRRQREHTPEGWRRVED